MSKKISIAFHKKKERIATHLALKCIIKGAPTKSVIKK
jgi:hypothetical protein